MNFSPPSLFILFSGFLSLLLMIGQLVIRNRSERNLHLAGIYLCMAVIQTQMFLIATGLNMKIPHVHRAHTPFVFLLSPLLYFFLRGMLDDDFRPGWREWLQFSPVLLALLFLLPGYLLPAADKLEQMHRLFVEHRPEAADVAGFLPNLILMATLITLLIHFRGILRIRGNPAGTLLAIMVLLILSDLFLTLTAVLKADFTLLKLAGDFTGGILLLSYLASMRYPEFFQTLRMQVNRVKYQRSQLGNVDLEALAGRLRELVTEGEFFLDEKISLQTLASALEITPHQLSEYLNHQLGRTFFQYINGLRVIRACELLRSRPETPVITVAYQAGFNSKSSFHTAFVRETGVPPSEWRKNPGPLPGL